MPEGVVKFFNQTKGFGFVSRNDGGGDIFVHVSALHDSGLDDLDENDEVSFEIERDRRSGKETAVSLRVLARGVPSRGGARQPARTAPGRGRGVESSGRASAGSGDGVEVVQSDKGVWLHSAERRRGRCLRPYLGSGAGRPWDAT